MRRDGALTIRDIDDDVLTEKEHLWPSRKPSKRALQLAFYTGEVTISERTGMLKTYELMTRHFGWDKPPKPATSAEITAYLLDRALRSQGLVSLDSICHLDAPSKAAVRRLIEARVRRKELVPVALEGAGKQEHWARPEVLETNGLAGGRAGDGLVHILSPFDPLVIQRKRTELFFDYDHRFEAYVPKEKRLFGYFALPVLVGSDIVAAIDLKTDRQNRKLLMQKWNWVGKGAGRGAAQGVQAPHRGRAAIGSSGFSWRSRAQPSQAAARPACHSASTSWRAMPRVMNTMRERRSASGHSASATGGWKTWWTPWITTGVCSPRRLRMPLTRSRSSPRALRRYASHCETAIQSSGSSNASTKLVIDCIVAVTSC